MSNEFILDPNVIREATDFNPFKNTADNDFQAFEENVQFLGAKLKQINQSTVVEVTLQVSPDSTTGNANVKFKTDFWLNNAVCSGTARAKDVEERDWNTTRGGLRTLSNIAKAIGAVGENPVVALAAQDTPQGHARVRIRTYRNKKGEFKWEINQAGRVKEIA